MGAAVEAEAWPVTGGQLEDVREAARARARVDLCLENLLLVTVRSLDAAGVACRVLKGQAWAHSVYPNPTWRGFGDVDLLVHGEDWYRAIDVLRGTGARRSLPELRPGFDQRFGKDATLVVGSGWEIDLHRTLVVGPFGLWIDQRDLFAEASSFTIGGVSVDTLSDEASFLHACYNAALGDDPPRLIAVRDVCQVALTTGANPSLVEEMARRWRAPAVIARALELAADRLGQELWSVPIAAPFASARGTLFERALVATYRGPGRGYTSQLATVVAVRGAGDRLGYLRALARPQRAYLTARGWSPTAYLRTSARMMRKRHH
jgi:hypothetical protein